MRFVWRQELVRCWREDVAKVVAVVSECVQIGGVRNRQVVAMVSEGVQKVFRRCLECVQIGVVKVLLELLAMVSERGVQVEEVGGGGSDPDPKRESERHPSYC